MKRKSEFNPNNMINILLFLTLVMVLVAIFGVKQCFELISINKSIHEEADKKIIELKKLKVEKKLNSLQDKVQVNEDEKNIQIIFNKNVNYEIFKDTTTNQLVINIQKQ
ncbi:hypothetical protein A9299_09985 [Moraxella osloensis]|uniref:Uncharacterized protein n=1 Tax=Faucicola osloensis TaxID=34062 RepID=A0AA91FIT5_FAUOS|nr:hypothetical protein [Moraxella osloensis]OBX64326.1 hypothetical protein A9299_09985 [Moraxella osloensis]